MSDSIDLLIDALLEREGGYINHPADRGGATNFGITQSVARANGYYGPMRSLPRDEAAAIYKRLYWLRPQYDSVATIAPQVAAELFDTGVNMGPAVATTFLQRALTALNRNGSDYPDLVPDGRIGPMTLQALKDFIATRGATGAQRVLMRALEALQGERYLRLAERPAEDDDDAMLFTARPSAPHQEDDHRHCRKAAEHARGGSEQAVDVALALGEGLRWRQ